MRVFVAGGTGAIGRYAVSALVAGGHTVSALARNEAKARLLRDLGATPVLVSLFDRCGLAAAFTGHEAVANLASALPSPQRFILKSAWAECQRIRTEGSAAVVDAAIEAGVSRLVQESVVMIYRDGGSRPLDEDCPTDHYPNAVGNHAAESNAGRLRGSGCAAVVLRFGIFYGRGAAHSEQIMAMARRHVGFQPGRPNGFVSSIHLRDAAGAVVAALDCVPGTYNVVDDEPVTARDNTLAMADAVDARPWVIGPGRLALLLGDRTTSMTRSLRISNARFRSVTKWKPVYPSVREGYRAMANAQD
ncbi:epimerase [Mycobacterium sp. 852002-51613_SCH5001154]|uniref:NAD-dependent epimerase/dehydratase family protein n=1 Tax=Mycobacterium sp. 852002-51613_SCH5001154 TaxID=1834104 RepID=UPI0007FDCB6F|nr:NAD(P)H-binding protein [Mycobacterium sp. 852002-51613_SCH5001154]OBF74829.1 epimerase [Mycobacterium sp. 852002-51613_SCH5001154]